MQKISIQDSYFNILEMLDQQPGSEQILNALIQLESDIESAVFDILKNYQAQNKKINNTKIYQAMHSRNFELRNVLESRIMQIATGDKMSISDLLDQCIAHLNKILDNQENMEDILKKMKICYKKVEDTILPPDEKPIQTGSGNGWIEKREGYNKFGLLLNLLREKGIYTDDLYVAIGVNQENQMREQSYLYIYIPRINKIILINNSYGEKTFIYNGYIQLNYFLGNTKIGIKNNENIVGVNFDYENITNWKSKMNYYLFEKQETDKPLIGEKINVEKFVKRQDFVDFYEQLPEAEKKMVIGSSDKYKELAKTYSNIPKTYVGIISLLGGKAGCFEGGYIEALLKGEEEGKRYYEKRKKINSKKIRTREGFLDFYERLSEEEKKMAIKGEYEYEKLAENYLSIPKSYRGLISLLGGNNKCLGGGYVEALLKGEEEGKRYYEERKKINSKKISTREEFLDFYEQLSEAERKMVVGSSAKYKQLAKTYLNIPKAYGGIIFLLGGNNKCLGGGYIEALLKGEEEGKRYYEKRKKINSKKIRTREGFLDFYERLSEEEKKMAIKGEYEYKKLLKNYPNISKTYGGLISLLGGKAGCLGGGYVEALLKGEEEGKRYYEERKKMKK